MNLTVIGMPATQGSKRGFPIRRKNGKISVALVESGGEHHRSWREAVANEARHLFAVPHDGPQVVTMTFYLPRPKSAKKSVRFPDKKPDVLKLGRAVEDALSKILYTDDARIVDIHLRKRFAIDSPPRVEIEIRPATEDDV